MKTRIPAACAAFLISRVAHARVLAPQLVTYGREKVKIAPPAAMVTICFPFTM